MSDATAKSVPAGGRRFWVTVFCFAVANLGIWIGYDRLVQSRRHALLEVRRSAPENNSVVSGRPRFWWAFNLDVAPPQPDDPPPGDVQPATAGRWTWDNPRTLSFTPDAPLPRATPLTITLRPDRLHTPEGFPLNKPVITSVHTPALQVEAVRQAEFDERDRLVVEIAFNDDVLPADLLQHLSLISALGKPVTFALHGQAGGKTLRVITESLPLAAANRSQSYLKVRLSPGLSGRGGPLGLAAAYENNLPIGAGLAATQATAYFPREGDATLVLHFNNPVEPAALKPLLSVEPAVPFTLNNTYQGVELRGAFQPATRYAIKIAAAPAGVRRASCPRPDTLSVYVPDRPPSVWFEHDEGYLGSAGNRTLMAHAVNVTGLRVSLTRIYDNNLVAWRNSSGQGWVNSDAYARPVVTKNLKLPVLKNKTQDVALSLDELLPADAPRDGVYQVSLVPVTGAARSEDDETSDDRDGSQATAMVALSDIGLTAKSGRTATTVWATSLRTGEPVAGVRIRLYSSKNQFLGTSTTGEDGLATLAAPAPPPGEQSSVVLADRPAAASSSPATEPAARSAARDLTWLDLRTSRINYGDADTTGAPYLRSGQEAFIYTDRGVYRPGETVHLRAIVRSPDGAVPPSFPVRWQFRRPDLHDWKSFAGQIDADGAVSMDLPLPTDLPTGGWSVALGLPGHAPGKEFGSASFQVEDFMPNRMQVALNLEGVDTSNKPLTAAESKQIPRLFVKDEPAHARVQADYLFGRPVTERPATLVARIDPATFAPPQWQDWTFGDAAATFATLDALKITGHRAQLPEQALDDHGGAQFDLDLAWLLQDGDVGGDSARQAKHHPHSRGRRHTDMPSPAVESKPVHTDSSIRYVGPWRLTVTASVTEVGGRAVSATRTADLDPVPWYIAVRPRTSAATLESPTAFDIALVTPAGQVAADDAELEAMLFRETWNNSLIYDNGRYAYHSTRLLEPVLKKLTVRTDGGKGTCQFQPTEAGAYVLRLRDPESGCLTSVAFYAGSGAWQDNISRENPDRLELIVRAASPADVLLSAIQRLDLPGILSACRDTSGATGAAGSTRLPPGQPAQVIVRSPFAGRLLLTVETDDVVSARVLDMPASHAAVPIDISDACRPNAFVTATVIRPIDPDAPWQTHRAIGTIRIPVDNSDRRLNLKLEAPPEMRPAATLSARLRVTDCNDRPVENAAVTVAAVDEGICQLTGFTTPDPFAFFTRNRALGVGTADLYSQLMPEVPKQKNSPVGGDRASYDPRHTSPISARRVKPVALVCGVLHTDAQGFTRADFSVPQFTGRLRLMAVASSPRGTGAGESATLVRSSLLVQSSWPRFAAPRDEFRVPLVIFNNTAADAEATVTVHVSDGPLQLGPTQSRDVLIARIKIKAGGQSTQFVQAAAGGQCGVSHATLAATLGTESYEEDVELPVRPASPELQLGGYAVATPAQPANVSVPGGMLEGTARLHVKVTPWPSLQLPQGLDSLERYPYGCLEQTTSTLFPLAYLSDIGGQIAPGMFEKQRVEQKVQAGITRLIGMQTADGGLAMWPGYSTAWPWGSVYAAHFLVEAHDAGHAVPAEFQAHLLAYLHGLLNRSSDDPDLLETQAYGCYVLALAGSPPRAAMARLTQVVQTPRPDGVAYAGQARLHLAAAWLAAGRRDRAQELIPQVLPQPRIQRSLGGALGSPVRDRAILVSTLLAVQPDHPAFPDLVQQLADAGAHGQWRSTQDTAFAVLALGRYIRQSKAAVPYAGAELLQDGRSLARAADGHAAQWNAGAADVPLPPDQSKLELRITGDAGAKGYLSWVESGVPLDPPAPADHGLAIRRRLLDSHGKPLAANTVQSGDLVQVELSISADTPLEHVVIDDPLPAGLEIENPRLLTTASDAVARPSEQSPVNLFHDTRLDMRDDRLVLVGDLTAAGHGSYVYTARAVTPGNFVIPPAHAECMYDSGTNSLSAGGRLTIIPAGSAGVANVQE